MSTFVIDAGNSRSVRQAVIAAGGSIASSIDAADNVIIPGQGAMRDRLIRLVDKPTLAICVGMQMLFEHSDEGNCPGLGFMSGNVHKLKAARLPHMGWNTVERQPHPMWQGIDPGARLYFAHSYATTTPGIGRTLHGEWFTSAVACGKVWGVQFHPEKSCEPGLRLLRNFLEHA